MALASVVGIYSVVFLVLWWSYRDYIVLHQPGDYATTKDVRTDNDVSKDENTDSTQQGSDRKLKVS